MNRDSVTIISVCQSQNVGEEAKVFGVKDYEEMSIRLVKSIRRNGGRCKDCPIIFWVPTNKIPKKETLRRLSDYNCKFVFGETPIPENNISNKIAACMIKVTTPYVVWMDTDMHVLSDFSGMLPLAKDIMVVPTSRSTNKWAYTEDVKLWRDLYGKLGLKMPEIKVKCPLDGGLGNFYFSSGLFAFKSALGFGELYLATTKRIIEKTFLTATTESLSQVSLTVSIVAGNLSFGVLSRRFHRVYSVERKIYDGDVIIHHQGLRIKEVSDAEWNTEGV